METTSYPLSLPTFGAHAYSFVADTYSSITNTHSYSLVTDYPRSIMSAHRCGCGGMIGPVIVVKIMMRVLGVGGMSK